MKLTLIITTYNWPESLCLVLKSVKCQTISPDEIIIADDGSNKRTKDLISNMNTEFEMNIIHSWQEDKGFRAARSRNNAIFKSSGDYIILIDGDVILHHNFIQDHLANAEIGYFVQGTRALVSKNGTKKVFERKKDSFSLFSLLLKNRKNAIHSNFLARIFSNKNNDLIGIRSCNLAFYRKDCININGFNNDFEGWGREDSEFIVRLLNSGIKRKNVRFNAIQFHLWHNENSRHSLEKNNAILDYTLKNHIEWCENGINSIEK